ncbi:serine-rich adhesin for platelets [Anabrus simplex]|uniref:serine-rich adhesin for platelets n=1 Tax=Anabrus simplex TaxID=316456 RepID=UPI0035A2DFA1
MGGEIGKMKARSLTQGREVRRSLTPESGLQTQIAATCQTPEVLDEIEEERTTAVRQIRFSLPKRRESYSDSPSDYVCRKSDSSSHPDSAAKQSDLSSPVDRSSKGSTSFTPSLQHRSYTPAAATALENSASSLLKEDSSRSPLPSPEGSIATANICLKSSPLKHTSPTSVSVNSSTLEALSSSTTSHRLAQNLSPDTSVQKSTDSTALSGHSPAPPVSTPAESSIHKRIYTRKSLLGGTPRQALRRSWVVLRSTEIKSVKPDRGDEGISIANMISNEVNNENSPESAVSYAKLEESTLDIEMSTDVETCLRQSTSTNHESVESEVNTISADESPSGHNLGEVKPRKPISRIEDESSTTLLSKSPPYFSHEASVVSSIHVETFKSTEIEDIEDSNVENNRKSRDSAGDSGIVEDNTDNKFAYKKINEQVILEEHSSEVLKTSDSLEKAKKFDYEIASPTSSKMEQIRGRKPISRLSSSLKTYILPQSDAKTCTDIHSVSFDSSSNVSYEKVALVKRPNDEQYCKDENSCDVTKDNYVTDGCFHFSSDISNKISGTSNNIVDEKVGAIDKCAELRKQELEAISDERNKSLSSESETEVPVVEGTKSKKVESNEGVIEINESGDECGQGIVKMTSPRSDVRKDVQKQSTEEVIILDSDTSKTSDDEQDVLEISPPLPDLLQNAKEVETGEWKLTTLVPVVIKEEQESVSNLEENRVLTDGLADDQKILMEVELIHTTDESRESVEIIEEPNMSASFDSVRSNYDMREESHRNDHDDSAAIGTTVDHNENDDSGKTKEKVHLIHLGKRKEISHEIGCEPNVITGNDDVEIGITARKEDEYINSIDRHNDQFKVGEETKNKVLSSVIESKESPTVKTKDNIYTERNEGVVQSKYPVVGIEQTLSPLRIEEICGTSADSASVERCSNVDLPEITCISDIAGEGQESMAVSIIQGGPHQNNSTEDSIGSLSSIHQGDLSASVEEIEMVQKITRTKKANLVENMSPEVEEVKTVQKVVTTRRGSRLQSHQDNLSNVSGVKETKTVEKITTTKKKSHSVVGEPPRMSDVEEIEETVGRAITRRKKSRSVQSEPPMLADVEEVKTVRRVVKTRKQLNQPEEGNVEEVKTMQKVVKTRKRLNSHTADIGTDSKVSVENPEPSTVVGDDILVNEDRVAVDSEKLANSNISEKESNIMLKRHLVEMETYKNESAIQSCSEEAEMPLETQPSFSELYQVEIESKAVKEGGVSMNVQPTASEPCQVDNKSETPAKKEMSMGSHPTASESCQADNESETPAKKEMSMGSHPTASESCQADNESETPAKKAEMSMSSHPTASESCQADNESETPAKKAEMSMDIQPAASELCQVDHESETPAKEAEMSMGSYPTASELCQADNESETAKEAEISMGSHPIFSESCQADNESETPAKKAEMSMDIQPTASESCQVNNESETPAKEAGTSIEMQPTVSESCKVNYESEVPAKEDEISMDMQPAAGESCQIDHASGSSAKEAEILMETQLVESGTCQVDSENETPPRKEEILKETLPTDGEICRFDYKSESAYPDATEINKIDHLHELEERTQNKKRTSKRKSGLIVENIELTKERLRPRQSSSIQSEPPALSDVDISVYDSSQQKSKVESTSIQSEPCDLADVSTMSDTSLNISLQRKTRSTKRSTSSAKKKITRSRSYRLSLREKPPIHLSDVLEVNESEIPSTAADHQNISVAEQGTKHVKTSGNEGKSDKYCSSISSKSTVEYKIDVDERKDGKAKSSECIEIIDSPHSSNSLSSKSTVEYIAGMSEDEKLNQKRDASSGSVPVSNKMEQTFEAEKKQSRSSSKTEAPHQVLSPAPGNSSQPDDENSHRDQMAEYASTRRLTRHQRSLMSRSMGVHKASHKTRRTSSRLDASTQEEDSVDSNEESEVSSIATRSSVKLLEHRKLSPSSGSQLSVLKESSQSPKSVGRMSSKSRTSQRSRRSVRRDARLGTPSPARSEASMASSMASSQSQALHSPGSSQSGYASKPRRRSFQRAQQALVSSPVPKIVHSKDHSESESVGDGSVNEEDTIGSNVHRRRSHRRSLLLPSVQEENNPESDGEADITDSESIVSVGSRQTRSSVQQMQKTKDSSDKGKELFSFSSPLQVSKNFKEETGSALGFVFSPPETHVLRKTRSSHISEHPSSLQTITEESSSNSSKTSSKTSTSKHKNHKDSDESGGKSEQSSPSSSPVKKKLTSSPSKTTPKKRKSTPQSLKEKYSKLRRKSVSKTSPRRPRGVFFTPLPEEEKRLAKERQSNVSRKSTAHKFHSAFKSRTSFSLKRKTK